MGEIAFQEFPKIPRLRRDMVVTEKIDGTNAAVGILPAEAVDYITPNALLVKVDGTEYAVYAQSRKRLITPDQDNYGFARYVWDHACYLVADLGPGLHFGEWWGYGINRGYGLDNRRFSLFNANRWEDTYLADGFCTPRMHVVPVLWRGGFDDLDVPFQLKCLTGAGSVASPGYMRPEGIVIFHKASKSMFKVLVENDDEPKSLARTLASVGEFSLVGPA